MNDVREQSEEMSYLCPVCDTNVATEPPSRPHDAPCPDCGYPLWCCKRMINDVAVMYVIPGSTPEHTDIERLADSLVRSGQAARVIVETSALDFMSSAFIARLVALNKRTRAANGRLILCGLHPFVREAFHDSRLERVFEIADDLGAALASF